MYGTYDDDVFDEGGESYAAHLPWARNRPEKCFGCERAVHGRCAEHGLNLPKVAIPYPLSPEVDLPCVGLWKQYDGETVTAEMAERCGACPARDWCLQTALQNKYEGVWAGTNTTDRRSVGTNEEKAAA